MPLLLSTRISPETDLNFSSLRGSSHCTNLPIFPKHIKFLPSNERPAPDFHSQSSTMPTNRSVLAGQARRARRHSGPGRCRHCRGRWLYRRFQVQSWGSRFSGFSINNGFKGYVTLNHALAAKTPSSLSFLDASVFSLCVTTSSLALFGKDYLALPSPALDPPSHWQIRLDLGTQLGCL